MGDTNTSGDELLLTKARKPYTITKQRERWTEDEHDRFLEALRLYGRAWQRIEEHIGTKTAVQIRSHAQKFFTKLEKEAEAKGIQALDIEIPPPRPKRKPNTPYPRKPGNKGSSSSQAPSAKLVSSASSSQCNQAFLDLEKVPITEETSTRKENQDDNCSGVSTVNKFPLPKKATQKSEPSLRKESADNGTSKASNVDNMVQDVPEKNNDSARNYPLHFPAAFVNGNMAKCTQFHHPPGMVSPDLMFCPMGDRVPGHSSSQHVNLPSTTTSSATTTTTSTTSQQAFPACPSQDSFLHFSSAFPNLIMSSLLQNPAAHAAATFAASVWPFTSNVRDSSTQINASPPSIAAIAAATVAAATAWWASHGLLPPVCAPPTPVTGLPLPTTFAVPTPATDKMDTVQSDQLPPLEKQNTALQDQNLPSRSPDSSSDGSEETGITKLNANSKTNGDKEEEVIVDAAAAAALHDPNASPKKKLVDRSSCGSNTPSGSDVETDALDKMEKDNEHVKEEEADANQPGVIELSNRRSKINNNQTTDSWKEVSQGGRKAFQALFARERLPQSFSPPQVAENVNGQQSDTSMPMAPDLSNKIDADQESVVMIGNGLKTRQSGFKPYKRCSMEVKENQVGNTDNQSDEKVCKRLRLEGEAST